MTSLRIVTRIAASPEACFDLARDVDVHTQSLAHTSERVTEKPDGRSRLELGDTVTFEGRHVGIPLRHRARITAFDRPRHFRDEMLSGLFGAFIHDHAFALAGPPEASGVTLMTDTIQFAMPLWWGGPLADRLVIRPYLLWLLTSRAKAIQAAAETAWASGARG